MSFDDIRPRISEPTSELSVIPDSYILGPDPETGPIALLLCRTASDGRKVTIIVDATWLLTYNTTDDDVFRGAIVPPKDVSVRLAFFDWPDDWDSEDIGPVVINWMTVILGMRIPFSVAARPSRRRPFKNRYLGRTDRRKGNGCHGIPAGHRS